MLKYWHRKENFRQICKFPCTVFHTRYIKKNKLHELLTWHVQMLVYACIVTIPLVLHTSNHNMYVSCTVYTSFWWSTSDSITFPFQQTTNTFLPIQRSAQGWPRYSTKHRTGSLWSIKHDIVLKNVVGCKNVCGLWSQLHCKSESIEVSP